MITFPDINIKPRIPYPPETLPVFFEEGGEVPIGTYVFENECPDWAVSCAAKTRVKQILRHENRIDSF